MRRTPYPLLFNPEQTNHVALDYQHAVGAAMDYRLTPDYVLGFVDRVRTQGQHLYFHNGGATPGRPDDWDCKRWQEFTSTPEKLASVLKYGNHGLVNELQLSYYKVMHSIFWDTESPHHTDLILQGPLLLLAKELGYIEAMVDHYGTTGHRGVIQKCWCDGSGRAPFVPSTANTLDWAANGRATTEHRARAADGLIAMGELSSPTGGYKSLRRPCFLRLDPKFKVQRRGFYEYAHIRQDRLMQTIGSGYIEELAAGPSEPFPEDS